MKPHHKKLVFAAMCLALALVLPFLTGQIPEIGKALAPMHIPVLLCGFICGPLWATAVGAVAPLLRTMLFGMPAFPADAVPMAFELAAYGLLAGLLYHLLPKKTANIYIALLGAMLGGRAVWGVAKLILTVAKVSEFTAAMFIAGAFTKAIPGIIAQILLVPLIVMALRRSKLTKEQ